MFQVCSLIMENGEYQIVSIFVQYEPWRTEGILEILHYMDFPSRRVSFCQKKGFFSIAIDSYINHHDSMAILLSITGRIDKHVTWLHVCQSSGLHLAT